MHWRLKESRPDTHRVELLLQLSRHFLNIAINKEIQREVNLDSSYFYSSKAAALSTSLSFGKGYIQSQYLLGSFFFQKGEEERARALVKQALEESRHYDRQLQAEGWYFLGECYGYTAADLTEKIRFKEQSMEIYRQTGNTEQQAYLLEAIANLHYIQGQTALANIKLQQVLALYGSINYPLLHYTYNLLAAVNREMGNYKESIQYSLAAIESSSITRDTSELGEYNATLARTYLAIDQREEALFYYRSAFKYAQQEKNLYYIHDLAGSISRLMIAGGQTREALAFYIDATKAFPPYNHLTKEVSARALAECYLALKEYAQAEKYFLEAVYLLETERLDHGGYMGGTDIYKRAGNFYLTVKQYDKADSYLDKAIGLNAKAGSLRHAVDLHLLMFKVDSARGNFREAIAHYQRHKWLNDSIFNETKSKQIANLQIQYKTQQKDQDLKLKQQDIALLTKQNQVQQASIQQKEFQRNTFIAGSLLLLLFSVVVYNRYRLKQQSNRKLEQKQQEINQKHQALEQVLLEMEELLTEKEWMLKEIHHRVKNNLHTVMSLLNSQACYLQDEKALSAIQESQHRVYAMSLIHQRLYQSKNLARVELSAYVREVVEYLGDSFDVQERIRFCLSVACVELDVSIAVPLGLLINEAVTNSLKYGFADGRSGTVSIGVEALGEENYLLTIADDGMGLDKDFDPVQSNTLGMSLMRGLSRQLGGSFDIQSSTGVRISLIFANTTDASPYPDAATVPG
ncbi:histidine kinase dimerization/phosphoacceptor domain -containing protein [Cesiribacter sp. SM1]|uniref:tetratricopeptide repeat-containing sensor histidine kinase n=1 Tax=Cesiribacter sp. SM1 TaxID=2861196 RepID=UPI001CD80436